MRKLHNIEEKVLLMQSHAINIEKANKTEGNKIESFKYCILKLIRWGVGPYFKIIISQKSNAFERNHSDESYIGAIYITFLEKHFSAKVY